VDIARAEGLRGKEASLSGAEGQVSGRVFQRPISKFNFRAKTSLCLFSSTSFLSLLVFFFSSPHLLFHFLISSLSA
jgi:hypothetical protein